MAPAIDSWQEASRDFANGREPEWFWTELRRELWPMVTRRLRALPQDRDDVIGDTLLDLIEMRARGRFDPEKGTVTAVAVTIARARCNDRLRRYYRLRSHSLDAMVDDPSSHAIVARLASSEPGVEDQVIARTIQQSTWRRFCLAVREVQREDQRHGSRRALAVCLRYHAAIAAGDCAFLYGERAAATRSWREVAMRLGTSEQAARQLGSRGQRALLTLMQGVDSERADR